MRYRVTFMERAGRSGHPVEAPTSYLANEVADDVVIDKNFVERTEPVATHNQDTLDEDDDFLSVGTEVWDYDVVNERQDDFLAAVKNSRMAVDCVLLEESSE